MNELSIKVDNLSKKFGKKKVLDSVSFELDCGIHALIGPNGSGKTTLLRCIANIYSNYEGIVCVNGKNAKSYGSNYLGYLPQKFGCFDDVTVSEAMKFFCSIRSIKRKQMSEEIDQALRYLNLYDYKKVKCGKLSGGMIRRLGIAQATLGKPKLVLLDEPTVGLDPEEKDGFMNLLKKLEEKCIIILSTHDLSVVDNVCDNVILLDEGKKIFNKSVKEFKNISGIEKKNNVTISEAYKNRLHYSTGVI